MNANLRVGSCKTCKTPGVVAVLEDDAWTGTFCKHCHAREHFWPVRTLSGAREAAKLYLRSDLQDLTAEQLRAKIAYLAAGMSQAALVTLALEASLLPQRDLSSRALAKEQQARSEAA